MAKTKIFLTQNVKNVGIAGDVVDVSEGFAVNYLIARKLGIRVTKDNQSEFVARKEKVEKLKTIVTAKTSQLAEKISALQITVASKLHDDGKLYGALRPQVIVEAMADKGIIVSKNMIIFDKPIKAKGLYTVTVKLSTSLQPKMVVKVVAE